MREPYDVVVVGAGHNGLVAAFYLARAGLRTVVVERRPIVGGACTTEEFAPGFKASPGAYVLSMLRGAVWRDLGLRERGLIVDEGGPSLNVYPTAAPRARGRTGSGARCDPGPFGVRCPGLPRVEQKLERIAASLMPMFDVTAPNAERPRLRELPTAARLAYTVIRGRRALDEMAFLFVTSASRYLDEHFEDEMVKSALGCESISNTLAGPSTAGTAYGQLHEAASGGSGGGVGWGFVRGGMGTVTSKMADAAREAGAEIRTEASVERIDVRGDRAVGVVLADEEEIVLAEPSPTPTPSGPSWVCWTPRSCPRGSPNASASTGARGPAPRSTSRWRSCRRSRGSTTDRGCGRTTAASCRSRSPWGSSIEIKPRRERGAGDRCARRALHPVGPRSFVGAGRPPRRDARRARAAVPVARRFVGRGA